MHARRLEKSQLLWCPPIEQPGGKKTWGACDVGNADRYVAPAYRPTIEPIRDISELAKLSSEPLGELFAAGKAPDLAGFAPSRAGKKNTMKGGVLSAPFHNQNTWLGKFITGFASLPIFPWRGKVALTAPDGGHEGTGKNSMFKWLYFPFNYGLVPSKLDPNGDLVVRLDYKTPNGVMRFVHDEIREVGPGVFLGMAGLQYTGSLTAGFFNAMLKAWGRKERVVKGGPIVPIIYFALQGTKELPA